MNIYAIISTRSKDTSDTTNKLTYTLSSFGIKVILMVNQSSIFEAYDKGFKACNPEDNDIVIFCHDDIEILDSKMEFLLALAKCLDTEIGIVGPAGTTFLDKDAVWWNHDNWRKKKHRGVVAHIDKVSGNPEDTYYGPQGPVVVLDGLFLAARAMIWKQVGLAKPIFFKGNWDFYDIFYTYTSHTLRYTNHTIPIKIIHKSSGELVGRDSWHDNRVAFINHVKLPISC